jgi:hypothetical protein
VLAFSARFPLVATWSGPPTTPRLRPLCLLSGASKSGKRKDDVRDGALNLVIAVLVVIILVILALRFF